MIVDILSPCHLSNNVNSKLDNSEDHIFYFLFYRLILSVPGLTLFNYADVSSLTSSFLKVSVRKHYRYL